MQKIGLSELEKEMLHNIQVLVKQDCIDEVRFAANLILKETPEIDIEQFIKLTETIVNEAAVDIAAHRFMFLMSLKKLLHAFRNEEILIEICPPPERKH